MDSEGWKTYKLGQIIDDIAMGPFGSNITVDNFIHKGVPVIRGGNLNEGGFIDKKFVFISEEKAQSLKRSLAFPDDLVFTHRGTIGQVGIIPYGKYSKYLVSQSQMKLTVNKNYLCPLFLYYFFKSPLGQYQLLKNSSQVGVPAIAQPTASIKEIDINLPPLPTQRRITAILSVLDDKIELNRQINATLEAIAQTIFKEWFVNFRFPGATGHMQDSELGPIPIGWRVDSILSIADLLSGGTPSTSISDYWNGDIKWVSAKDVINSQGTYLIDTERKITVEGIENSNTKILPEGTTIVTARGTVGSYCLLSEPMTMNQTNYGLKAKMNGFDFFIFFTLANLVAQLKQASYGTIFDTITTITFEKSKIIIPPEEIMHEFNNICDPIMNHMLINLQQIATLAKIRDALLPKLMNGEIEV